MQTQIAETSSLLLVAAVVPVLALVEPRPASAQHTSITTTTCPVCTEAQRDAWLATNNSTIRLRPRDVLGHRIGLNRAERLSGSPKYRPIRHEKQIGCGKFHSFGLHTNNKGEWDWNLKIRPSSFSQSMHDEIRAMTPASKLQEWPCDGDCFKGEITTDNGFRNNPYFNVDVPYLTLELNGLEIPYAPDESKATSILSTADDLCLYGPWVQDLGHSDHPEIHPSEVVWFKDQTTGAIFALLLQDDSNRFDRQSNFRMDDQPNWSRPWSAFPRWTDVRVAFFADPTAAIMGQITVDGIENHRVLTKFNDAASGDGGGSTHDLIYNGTTIMRVTELESPSDRIGVTYADLCRLSTADGELIIGYASLQTVIGDHDRGDGGDERDEGYYVLKITVDDPQALAIVPDFLGVRANLLRWRRTVTPADSARRFIPIGETRLPPPRDPRFRLSLGARRPSGTGSTASLLNVTRRALVQGSVRLNARPMAHLPLLQGGLAVVRDGQDSMTVRIPRHQMSATLLNDSASGTGPRQLDFLPEYVVKDSSVDADESPLADALNAVIGEAARGDRGQLGRIFGTAQPFSIRWSFAARDLTAGRPVPVSARLAEDRVSIEVANGAFRNSRVLVRMPRSGAYELSMTAEVSDADGNRGRFTHVVTAPATPPR